MPRGKGRRQRVERGAEWADQLRLATAQFEQRRHGSDIHNNSPKYRHSDDTGGQRHAADGDQRVGEDRGDTDHAAGEDRQMRGAGAAVEVASPAGR